MMVMIIERGSVDSGLESEFQSQMVWIKPCQMVWIKLSGSVTLFNSYHIFVPRFAHL